MTHHKYISIIAISGLIAWVAFALVLFKMNPYESMGLALSFFYVSSFVALSCTFTVIGFYFRVWLFKNEIFYKHINIALRQGVILALIAIFCMVFQMLKVMTWWSGFLLVAISVLFEAYFSSRDAEFI